MIGLNGSLIALQHLQICSSDQGATTAAAETTQNNRPLFTPVPIEEETGYAAAASQQGINMNDPAAREAWMADRVSTRAGVVPF